MAFQIPLTSTALQEVSTTTLIIAGQPVAIFGLSELPPANALKTLTVVHLLHPRLSNKLFMANMAKSILGAFNDSDNSKDKGRGIICTSISHRNHDERVSSDLRNQSWTEGNEMHAVDMFSIYHGTSIDLSLIIDYLPSQISAAATAHHLVAGVSLGGHSTWLSVVHDERVTAAAVVIGCLDYVALMTHRAEKSRLPLDKPGVIVGTRWFPTALWDVVKKVDPAAMGAEEVQKRLRGKQVFVLSGAMDKLVPPACSARFLEELRGGADIKEKVYQDAGHVCTLAMVEDICAFVKEVVEYRERSCTAERL